MPLSSARQFGQPGVSGRNLEHCADFAQATERDREAVLAVAAGPAAALGEVERDAVECVPAVLG